MKYIYLIATFLFIGINSFAAVNVAESNGLWRSASTWSLDRQPSNNDTVLIPAGRTITVDNNWNFGSTRLVIRVYGTLNVAGGGSKLTISGSSVVYVYSGGRIQGTGSPSEVIKIGDNTVFKGNQPAISGPSMASSSTSGFDSFSESALPVKFIGFSLLRQQNNVLVQWSTSEEVNADHYELQRSFDGSNWTAIAYILAVGNSSNVNNYQYNDKNVTARVVYYRIRQVDADNRFVYTPVKHIRTESKEEAAVNIASAGSKLVLQFPAATRGQVQVRIVGVNGQILEQQQLNAPAGQVVLSTKTQLKGVYVVEVGNDSGLHAAKQILL